MKKKGDRKEFDARYWQMQACEQQLAKTKDVTLKVQRIRELLDVCNQVRVLEKILALAAGGISILFATHDPDHAFLASQRVLLLAEGRALEVGAPADVIRSDSLQRLYGVSVEVLPLAGGRHICLPELR